MTTRRTAWVLLALLACEPTDAPVGAEASGDETGGSAGTPTTGTPAETGDATTGDATTGGGSLAMCEPTIAEIPEEAFVATFVDTVCAQKEMCGCPDPTCAFGFADDLEAIVAEAKAQGMVYDPKCAAEAVAGFVSAYGCLSGSQVATEGCPGCTPYRGSVQPGEMCTTTFEPPLFLFGDPCAGDAYCNDPTCELPNLDVIPVGATCFAEDDYDFGTCEPGTGCDVFDSNRCEPELPEGADCTVLNGVCKADNFCTPLGVCEAYRDEGEPCGSDYDCKSIYCVDNVCVDYVWICELRTLDGLFGPPG